MKIKNKFSVQNYLLCVSLELKGLVKLRTVSYTQGHCVQLSAVRCTSAASILDANNEQNASFFGRA